MSTHEAAPTSNRILVVEDEVSISDVVSTALRYQGHTVTHAGNGLEGLALARSSAFDLVILDVMLPGMNGFDVCRRMREGDHFVPVLFLTARADAKDRIDGFVAGGDDYLTKPFSVDELMLRVSAILRRTGGPKESATTIAVEDLVLDSAARSVHRGTVSIELSPTEFRLLHYLMINKNVVVSKAQILASVWDYDYDGSENVVELYVGYLRRKIDDGRPALIHTKRGAGYIMKHVR